MGGHVGRADLVRLTDTLIPVLPAAIVFDFDGTMVDTETPEYDSVRRVFADYGLELPPDQWIAAAGTMWGADWVDQLHTATTRASPIRTRHADASVRTSPSCTAPRS